VHLVDRAANETEEAILSMNKQASAFGAARDPIRRRSLRLHLHLCLEGALRVTGEGRGGVVRWLWCVCSSKRGGKSRAEKNEWKVALRGLLLFCYGIAIDHVVLWVVLVVSVLYGFASSFFLCYAQSINYNFIYTNHSSLLTHPPPSLHAHHPPTLSPPEKLLASVYRIHSPSSIAKSEARSA